MQRRRSCSDLCATAVWGGHLTIMKWAAENGFRLGEGYSAAAAGFRDFQALKWLHERGCPWGWSVTRNSIHGQLEMFKWAVDKGCPVPPESEVCWDPGMVNWGKANGYLWRHAC